MKPIQSSGKRKRAKARAVLHPGTGRVYINGEPLALFDPQMARIKIQEPIALAEKFASKYDIFVEVSGGGVNGQAEAARLAIGRALAQVGGDKLKKIFLDYDRAFLVADVRYKEKRKPNSHGKARAKRQKSYR